MGCVKTKQKRFFHLHQIRGQRQGDVGQPEPAQGGGGEGRGGGRQAGGGSRDEVVVVVDRGGGGGAREAGRRHPVAQAGGGAPAAAGALEEVVRRGQGWRRGGVPRRRAGRQEGHGGGGAVQGERERLDPEPHSEARARRPGVVGRQVRTVGAGGPWCPMDGSPVFDVRVRPMQACLQLLLTYVRLALQLLDCTK